MLEGLNKHVPPDFSLGVWSVNRMAVLPVFSICACACSQAEGERWGRNTAADPDLVWVSVLWRVTSMWVGNYHSTYSSQPPSYWELCQRAHGHPVTMTSSSQKRLERALKWVTVRTCVWWTSQLMQFLPSMHESLGVTLISRAEWTRCSGQRLEPQHWVGERGGRSVGSSRFSLAADFGLYESLSLK